MLTIEEKLEIKFLFHRNFLIKTLSMEFMVDIKIFLMCSKGFSTNCRRCKVRDSWNCSKRPRSWASQKLSLNIKCCLLFYSNWAPSWRSHILSCIKFLSKNRKHIYWLFKKLTNRRFSIFKIALPSVIIWALWSLSRDILWCPWCCSLTRISTLQPLFKSFLADSTSGPINGHEYWQIIINVSLYATWIQIVISSCGCRWPS